MSKTATLYLQFVGVWIVLQIAMVVIHSSPVLHGELVGPDSYMRLVRVDELLSHGRWHDSSIPRSNAPYGEHLHWTRPFDILLLGLAAPVALFAGWHEGLFWASVVVAPLLLLACGIALIWAMRPVIRPNSWLLPAIAILIQPGIVTYSMLGRPDHHIFLLLVFILAMGCLLRGLLNRFDSGIFFLCGLLCGFAVWLSVENLLAVLAIALALGLAWFLSPENRARQGVHLALGMLLVLLLAMVSTHPASQWLKPVYDKVGAVHVLLALLLLAYWAGILILERQLGRTLKRPEAIVLTALFGMLAFAAIYFRYRGFFGGPMYRVNPLIVPIWLDKVTEMKGVVPNSWDNLAQFVFYLGQGLVALPYLLWKLCKERADPAWMAWLGLAVAIVLYWPVATLHVRFSSFAEVLFIIVLADLVDRVLAAVEDWQSLLPRVLGKSLAICLLLVSSVGLGSLLMNIGKAEGQQEQESQTAAELCSITEMSRYLESSDNWPADKSLTILAFLDFGPELLYRTRHRVIGTPYHRNDAGILDSYNIMTANEPQDAKPAMDERDVDLVLLCPNSPERVFFSTSEGRGRFYSALAADTPPDWLVPVPLPEGLRDEFKLYEKRF